jgi:hypothetical protein
LYEATQGPQLPLEAPALNPTGGVKGKQPRALNYKPDPTRPGAGVFIAHKDSQDNFEDLPAGTVIKDSDGAAEGAAASKGTNGGTGSGGTQGEAQRSVLSSSAFAPPLPDEGTGGGVRSRNNALNGAAAGASMVNLTPLTGGGPRGGSHSNMNPAMNMGLAANPHHGQVQVMNVLDVPQAGNTLAELAMTDTTFLGGIPGGMFDWGAFFFWVGRVFLLIGRRTMGHVLLAHKPHDGGGRAGAAGGF